MSERIHQRLPGYADLPLNRRIIIASFVLGSAMLIACPKDGDYYPEGNWLFGPLWMLLIQDNGDKLFGVASAIVLLPMMSACLVTPSLWTGVVSLSGIVLWIGFGAWLAMVAVA